GNNLRGQAYQHYHGGGMNQVDHYNFRGLPEEQFTELLLDYTIADADWDASPALTGEQFYSSMVYDALGRMVSGTDPGGNVTEHSYNRMGLLKRVAVTKAGSGSADEYVSEIRYDAKGQRLRIYYGNGASTKYEYDPLTYRLGRIYSQRLGTVYQDQNYYYDAVGNITMVKELSWNAVTGHQDSYFSNTVTTPHREFTYDSLYRLTEAKGRETKSLPSGAATDNFNDSGAHHSISHPFSGTVIQSYTQLYSYDGVGNITELKHTAGTGSYTRTYNYASGSNKLLDTSIGSGTPTVYSNTYDLRGNIITLPHLMEIGYNDQNMMCYNKISGLGFAYYQYASGARSRKVIEKTGMIEERIYLGGYELYRKHVGGYGNIDVERSTVHVSDD
ncbi:MAG: hypothetical protein EOP49_46250, partial [Sphingobacteriales bacterium]